MVNHICEPISSNRILQLSSRGARWGRSAAYGRPADCQRFVFTTGGDRPFGGFSVYKRCFDQTCGVIDWTLHDLRRTALADEPRRSAERSMRGAVTCLPLPARAAKHPQQVQPMFWL